MITSKDLIELARILSAVVGAPKYNTLGCLSRDRVLIHSDKDGYFTAWIYDVKTKELRRIINEPVSFLAVAKAYSSKIVYAKDVAKGREKHKLYVMDLDNGERIEVEAPPMRILGVAYDNEKIAFTGASEEELALYVARFDGSYEKLLKLNAIAMVTDVEGDYIAGFGILRGDPYSYEVFVYSFKTNELKVYTPRPRSTNLTPIIRKSKILFESNFSGKSRLYLYDIEANELSEAKFSHSDYYSYDPVEHRAYGFVSNIIWCVGFKEGRTKLFIDGKEVPTPRGCISGIPAFLSDGSVVLSVSSLDKPSHVVKVNVGLGSVEIIVKNDLPEDIATRIGEVRLVRYRSFDDLEIPMYVVESKAGSKPGKAVIYVHGGPWSLVADEWRATIAALVACGYHVLAPNFRGSTGFGEDFRRAIIGDPGGGDLKDIIFAKKWAIEQGIASEGEVCIMGYSYGGYATLLALGKAPDEWKCGVAGAPVADWEEMYALGDSAFKKFIEVLFGNKMELLKERSPIQYVGSVSAPLCIIQPQNDTRTPLKPVLKYVAKLVEGNKVFELHVIPDMGHVIRSVDDATKILLPALLFLKRYLG